MLQEAALARSAIIICGQREINSRTFVMMPSLLNVYCGADEQARLDILPGLLRARSWWAEESGRDLLTLLQRFGRSKASDTRDVIYALLGLSSDAQQSDLLRPDYQISTQETIQRCTAFILLQKGDVSSEPPERLPKWSMNEFLDSLHNLDLEVFRWAANEANNTLLEELVTCQMTKNNAQRLKEYMSYTSNHGSVLKEALKMNIPYLINLLLQTPREG